MLIYVPQQIGTNNDNIANQLDNIQKSLEGSGQLSRDDEDKLIEAIDPVRSPPPPAFSLASRLSDNVSRQAINLLFLSVLVHRRISHLFRRPREQSSRLPPPRPCSYRQGLLGRGW